MENRFGVKDFVLLFVLGVLILLVVLAMFQFDRQWDDVQLIRSKLDDQAKELRSLRDQIQQGVAVRGHAGGNPPTTQQASGSTDTSDPFYRLREVERMPSFARGDWVVSA